MMPLIRKEIRLLLPFWAIAIFLAVVPSIFLAGNQWTMGLNEGITWMFRFGAVLLGLAPFGQEFGLGTFPSLLAQPSERRKIWNTKVLLTLLAGLLVFLAFALAVRLRLDANLGQVLQQHDQSYSTFRLPELENKRIEAENTVRNFYRSEWSACLGGGALAMLVAVIGGFWTTLLFRQIGAALWFSILIPGVMLVISEMVGRLFSANPNAFLVPALLVYAIAGFIWARWMFFKAQDAQWLGGNISFLSLSPGKAQTDSTTARGQKPLVALLLKEFQSHQVSLLIGFGLLVLHIATLVMRRFVSMQPNSEMRFAFEAVPFLWLLIPWVIGCVAVAEERKLGTLEGQLCLPVSRRAQFAAKLAVVILLGIVLGGLMPCLLEALGALAGVRSEIVQLAGGNHPGTFFATVKETIFAAGLIATISFFASTLTRNTLHALGAAIPIAVLFFVLFAWAGSGSNRSDYFLWRGPLILIIGFSVSIVTVVSLSFWNYKRVHAGRNVWLRNALVLAVALFCAGISAAVIYQRPWELAMSLEPKHGPNRLNGAVRPEVVMPQNRVFALLPDGRIWAATDFHNKIVTRYWEEPSPANGYKRRVQVVSEQVPRSGMFVGGSNWLALAADRRRTEVVALQSDGSLWSILSVTNGRNFWNRWLGATPEPRRIGLDNDWKSLGSGIGYFAAVKQDGTLWVWGNNEDHRFGFGPTNNITEPIQMGTNSDWDRAFSGDDSVVLVKTNGDVWLWRDLYVNASQQRLQLTRLQLNGADWIEVETWRGDNLLVIRQDGSLWSRGYGRFFGFRSDLARYDWSRLGNGNDWAQVSALGPVPIGIKTNGRLVKTGTELFGATLGRPSAHRGWIAIDSYWQSFVALNADGTVSLWYDARAFDPNKFLAPSRRPLWSLNIFLDSKN